MAGTGRVYVSKVANVGTIQSTHKYDVTLQFDIAFNYGGHNNVGASYNVACDGSDQGGTSTFNISSGGGSWVWGNIATKTFRITMPTSGAAKTINFSAAINTGVTPSYISASGSYTLPAVTWEWNISYNANGGSGAPSSQTKTYGAPLTLSTDVPVREGYTFLGWSTSSTATTADYEPGDQYGADSSTTLYAVWKINTYTVSYDANGGVGAPDSQVKIYGNNLTLSSTIPTRANYIFKGWSTSSSSSSSIYSAGSVYSNNENITLYAVWELAYWVPKITNPSLARCDGYGVLNEYGDCVNVKFDWECCQIVGENEVASIVIKYAQHQSTEYHSTGIVASGKSGSVNTIIGDEFLSTDLSYDIVIEVKDDADGVSSLTLQLSASEFAIDFLAGGKGVAIGKPSETEELFEVAWNTKLKKQLEVDNTATFNFPIYAKFGIGVTGNINVSNGIDADDTLTLSAPKIKMEPTTSLTYDIPVALSADCDTLTSSGRWYVGDGSTNRPVNVNGWLESAAYSTNSCHQTYTTNDGAVYQRIMQSGTWGIWIGGLTNRALLWTGTLSKGGSVTVDTLPLYDRFMARTSDGVTMIVGTRHYDDDGSRQRDVRFVGGHDDGTSSYIFKASTRMEGTTLTLVCASQHKLTSSGCIGTSLTFKSLWGLA